MPSLKQLHPLAVAIALGLGGSLAAHAADVGPGDSAVVAPGDAVEDWHLEAGARLEVKAGAETGRITSFENGYVKVDGGKVTTANTAAISMVDGALDLINASVTSTGSIGLALGSSAGAQETSLAILVDSSIRGGTSGVELDSADLLAQSSRIHGDKTGVVLSGGRLELFRGSVVTGGVGLQIRPAEFWNRDVPNEVLIDGSRIEGLQGSAIVVSDQASADIQLRNGAQLTAANGVLLEVQAGSQASFEASDTYLVGDIRVEEGASADVVLAQSAVLRGQLHNVERLQVGERSRWETVADAQVGELDLRQGTVATQAGTLLQVGTLQGEGTFELDQGRLLVEGMASGRFGVQLASSGHEPLGAVVSIGGGDASFGLASGPVDAGAFAHDLVREGNQWTLRPQLDERGKARLSHAGEVVMALDSALETAWQNESGRIAGRMDKLRDGATGSGLWIDTSAAGFDVDSPVGSQYRQRLTGLALGVDTLVDDTWRLGAAVGMTRSSLAMERGSSAALNSYFLALYGGWKGDTGYYADAAVKINQFNGDVDATAHDGRKVSGSHRQGAVGATLESGRRFSLQEGWYVQPFAQLEAMLAQGQRSRLSNGLEVDTERQRLVTGKLGVKGGRVITLDSGLPLAAHGRIAVMENLGGERRVSLNTHGLDNHFSSGRTELALGLSSEVAPGWTISTELQTARGRNVDQPYGVNLGMGYRF